MTAKWDEEEGIASSAARIAENALLLLHTEITAAKREITAILVRVAVGLGLFALALVLLTFLLVALLGVAVTGFGDLTHSALLGWVFTAVAALVLAAILGAVGYLIFKTMGRRGKRALDILETPIATFSGQIKDRGL